MSILERREPLDFLRPAAAQDTPSAPHLSDDVGGPEHALPGLKLRIDLVNVVLEVQGNISIAIL